MSARATEDMPCPACGQPVGVWDGFCEACGTELTPPVVSAGQPGYVPQCPVCAADPDAPSAAVTADGYCESCGRKVPTSRDHVDLDSLTADLLSTVDETMQPTHVSLWTRST